MLTFAHPESRNRTALPVCLGGENSNRLVSLWDIVTQFDIFEFANIVQLATKVCETQRQLIDKPKVGNDLWVEKATMDLLNSIRTYCRAVGFYRCQGYVEAVLAHLKSGAVELNLSVLHTELEHTRQEFINETKWRHFILIDLDRSQFVDKERLFGDDVYDAFPSARGDIRDASNCLAAECDTAAVFHLMRVAEHGLRYLAKQLRIRAITSYGSLRSLEHADWGAVVAAIKNELTAARKLTNAKKRAEQLELYADAGDHCDFMKDIWRNSASHTRKPYSPEEALAALGRVKDFMVFLARTCSKQTYRGDR